MVKETSRHVVIGVEIGMLVAVKSGVRVGALVGVKVAPPAVAVNSTAFSPTSGGRQLYRIQRRGFSWGLSWG